ncbi:MAG: hypothetical protein EOM12_17965 [Verrucomicrobiae bacterium]|nr:hypothetical protein [Verrucomicrobiae bacterium]
MSFQDYEDSLRIWALQNATSQQEIDDINNLFANHDVGKSLYLQKSLAEDWGPTIAQAGMAMGSAHFSGLANADYAFAWDQAHNVMVSNLLSAGITGIAITVSAKEYADNMTASEALLQSTTIAGNIAIGQLVKHPLLALPLGFAWTEALDASWDGIYQGLQNGDPLDQIVSGAVDDIFGRVADIFRNGQDTAIIAGQELLENALCLARWALPDPLEDVLTKFGNAILNGSPLVIDLYSDGIELISLEDSHAYFDLDNDGFAELTGWLSWSDGLLAYDINQNGKIDNNGELFGSMDLDGFSILADYDSNADGKINSQDAIWGDLLVWRDYHNDGVSRADELFSLADFNITEIDLSSVTEVSYQLEGNTVTHEGAVTTTSGSLLIADVWFEHNNATGLCS